MAATSSADSNWAFLQKNVFVRFFVPISCSFVDQNPEETHLRHDVSRFFGLNPPFEEQAMMKNGDLLLFRARRESPPNTTSWCRA